MLELLELSPLASNLRRCVIEYLQRNVKKRLGWEPKHVLHRKNEIVQECGVQVTKFC